ncbi:MAG: hypothetical protein KC731_19705, partial [Myxococcales bacterium]|nr:hypothetical protein [Myxococcales bacterium]
MTLSKSPFRGPPLHLLVFAYRNRLTGSVVIDDARREHIVHFMDGAPAKVVTDEHIAPLLDVLERMGLLDAATADLERGTSVSPEDGMALVDRGLLDVEALRGARRFQVMRRLEHVLHRPATSRYFVHEGEDRAEKEGHLEAAAVDPLAVIMQGARLLGSREVVDANVAAFEGLKLCLRQPTKHQRLRLDRLEEAVVEAMMLPHRIQDLVSMGHDEVTVRRVVFGLMIAKSLARTAPSQPAPAATDGRAPAMSAPPPSSSREGVSSQLDLERRSSVPGQPPLATPFTVPPISPGREGMPPAPAMAAPATSRPLAPQPQPSAHPWPAEVERGSAPHEVVDIAAVPAPPPSTEGSHEPASERAPASGAPSSASGDASPSHSGDDAPAPGEMHARPTPKRPPPVPSAQRFAFAKALRPAPVPVIDDAGDRESSVGPATDAVPSGPVLPSRPGVVAEPSPDVPPVPGSAPPPASTPDRPAMLPTPGEPPPPAAAWAGHPAAPAGHPAAPAGYPAAPAGYPAAPAGYPAAPA